MPARSDISWGVERRLEHIELQLYWEGRFNRGSLVKQFQISEPQASADIKRYLELAPSNMIYDAGRKAYYPTSAFAPVVYKPSADLYLARVRAVAEKVVKPAEVMIGAPPEHDVVPVIHRRLDNDVVREVTNAIKTRSALLVSYQSFSSPEARDRWVAPHAVAYDGQRWHARAFCCEKQRFSDFALGRIHAVLDRRRFEEEISDRAWEEKITFVLVPHPGLSPGMKRSVETDYGMVEGRVCQETRVALAYYLYKNLGLDRDPETTPAEQYHVVAVNRDEIEAVIDVGTFSPREARL